MAAIHDAHISFSGGLPAVEVWTEESPPSTRASAASVSEESETAREESPRILNVEAEPDTGGAGQGAKSFQSEPFYEHSDSAKRMFPAPRPIPAPRSPAWKYLAAAIVILGGFGAVYGIFLVRRLLLIEEARRTLIEEARRTAPAPLIVSVPSSRAGFSANPENSRWKLTWDRDAVARLHPTDAVLSILDGGQDRRIPLSAPDLATGLAFYTSRTGDLLFSLKINVPGAEPVEEHVRVLEADRVAATSIAAPAQEAAAEVVTRSIRPFDAAGAAATPKPPRQESDIAEMPTPPPLSASALTAAPLQVPISPQPLLPALVAPLAGRASYSPPQAILQVKPVQPLDLLPENGFVVHVVVDIDETGKVTRVAPTGRTPTNFALVAAATQAAKAWRFRPATQAGRPVASQINLAFTFGVK